MTKEEAIQNIKRMIGFSNTLDESIFTLFPELEESEDEKARKWIYDYIRNCPNESFEFYGGVGKKAVLAYLEKQKEQKKPTLDDPDLYGDWDKDLLKEIHSWLGNLDGKYTPYTIDDIKLTARHFVEWQKQKEQKPITESKRLAHEVIEYLIRCGYSPVLKDDSKKEHFHIDIPRHEDDFWHSEEYKHCRSVLGEYYMEGDYGDDTYTLYIWRKEQKPEWSEEDERMLSRCIKSVECSKQFADSETYKAAKDVEMNWLKSLHPQPKQEWSEEDEASYNAFICEVVNEKMNPTTEQIKWLRSIRDRLKSLRPQPKVKWSVEDAEALDMCLDAIPKKWTTKSGILLTKWLKDNIRLQPKQEWSDKEKRR